MDAIPPIRAALVQHIKRDVHQGGHCWGKALQAFPDIPTPGTGDGLTPVIGNPYGQLCQKLPLQQGNCCAVVARKGAEGSASARRQL